MNNIEALMKETINTVSGYLHNHGGEVQLTAFVQLKTYETVPIMYPDVSVEAFSDLLRVILKLTEATGYVIAAESQYTYVQKAGVSLEQVMLSNPDTYSAVALIGEARDGSSRFCLMDIERDNDGALLSLGDPSYPAVNSEDQVGALAHLFGESENIDIDALIENMPKVYMDDINELVTKTRVLH